MHTMNASMWMEKVGMSLVSAIMIAGLPMALVAIVVQSL
ncbi:MAG: ABC-type long-subunit fatty acid transport system fused permease/ATPase subunit [Brevundimonas sp.]|jgi:ABC-type long-subunit fatty acid transport system fused permease/ATPase subunit